MATKSIYKNVNIGSKTLANGLINAMEKAESFAENNPKVVVQKRFEELKGEEIKSFLSKGQ